MSKSLLLEVGTEEIPARFFPKAIEDARGILAEKLAACDIPAETIQPLGTPRRIALLAQGLPERQPERTERILGPSCKAAYDARGEPTRAALGFAKKQGVKVSELSIERTDKGEYVAAQKQTGGAATIELLARILPETIQAIPFPKSMRWGEGDLRFVRPIHWVVALLDGDVVPFSLGQVKSGHTSRGHRFLHHEEAKINSPGDYVEVLANHGVIADPADRWSRIESEIHAWAATVDGVPVRDPELLERVTYLVECPTTVRGSFDRAYLDLPREVLVNAMREHQHYFSIEDTGGKLLPYFVSVLNISPKDHALVVKGNERVLRARLADARFFFEEDRKVSLEARVESLRGVLLHSALGSIHDKVQRLEKLVEALGSLVGADPSTAGAARRAARLCKSDLVTHMVGEFPDLQGVMGREYARRDGEPEAVARAIEEHYRPRFAGGPLPESAPGALLAVAEKLDALTGCFKAGLVPTATQDPYGLRRAALGIIAILLDRKDWRLPVDGALSGAFELHGEPKGSGVRGILEQFFRGRLQHHLVAAGHAQDVVEAVLSARLKKKRIAYARGREETFSWDVAGIAARVEVLSSEKRGEDFLSLATTFKRVVNILPPDDQIGDYGNLRDLTQPSELRLLEVFNEVNRRSKDLVAGKQYRKFFTELRKLKAPVDAFFENVRVLDADHANLRAQRLGLLKFITDLFYEIADFSKIAVEQENKN
jgi:glycyl-tRNA synthetase beta chain